MGYPIKTNSTLTRKNKDTVHVQCYEVLRDKRNAIQWEKLSAGRRKALKTFRYFTRLKKHCRDVDVYTIDTDKKLARFVRNNYGFGEFGVMFIGCFNKSKRYRPAFICTPHVQAYCPYKKRDKCKKWLTPEKFKVGMSCLRNKKFVNSYTPRARVVITVKEIIDDDDDFTFRFLEKHNRMGSMWFWKGEDKGEMRDLTEIENEKVSDQPVDNSTRKDIIDNI